MGLPEPPEGTLWAFEHRDRHIYVTDIDWRASKVEFTSFDQFHRLSREDDTMHLTQFARFVRQDDVYEVPL